MAEGCRHRSVRQKLTRDSEYTHGPGALAALLGGLDALVFTAGIGEHSSSLRRRICGQAEWLGLKLDQTTNEQHATRVSASCLPVDVLVVPTNEEVVIARATRRIVPGPN